MLRLSRRIFLSALALFGGLTTLGSAARPVITGAIRWDAWYADTGAPRQAQDALGYPPWQNRAPWFARIDGPHHLTAVGTQADMDEECAAAAAYGLSYWAFDMYAANSPMSVAWHLYQASAKRHLVNWCGIVGPGFLGNDPFRNSTVWQTKDAGWAENFAQPNYQKVADGRPLLYILWSDCEITAYFAGGLANFAESLRYLRARCAATGAGDPYIVIMAGKAAHSATIARAVGADAISNYIPDMGPPPVGAVPWTVLDARTQAFWTSLAAQGIDCIPIATTGWDTRARQAHPEPFAHHEFDHDPTGYFLLPNASELQAHLRAGKSFVREHPKACLSRALLIYSWDECDEGGNALIQILSRQAP